MHLHLGVQQPTSLEAMVRHVFMLVRDHRPTREHGIAVLAMAGEGVGADTRS
jgi:hypothetical protein